MKTTDLAHATKFILHVENEYDYIFESVHWFNIIKAIRQTFWQLNGKNLRIYVLPQSAKLSGLYTTKKDIMNSKEVNPKELYRDRRWDIFPEVEQFETELEEELTEFSVAASSNHQYPSLILENLVDETTGDDTSSDKKEEPE